MEPRKPIRLAALGPVCLLLMNGCSDSGNRTAVTGPAEVRVTALIPSRTVPGDSVVVQGTGFGMEAGVVLFDSASERIAAQLASPWSDTRLAVLVPPDAISGLIQVSTGTAESNTVSFTVVDPVLFGEDVLPLFEKNCIGCHAGPNPQQNLDVLSREGLLRGGLSGPAVFPRQSGESLLVRKLRGQAGVRMPKDGNPFTDAEILKVADWIDQGARNN